jgi:hypothetical protein
MGSSGLELWRRAADIAGVSSEVTFRSGQRVMAQRYWSSERYEAVYVGPGRPIVPLGRNTGAARPSPIPCSRVRFADGEVLDVATVLIEVLV